MSPVQQWDGQKHPINGIYKAVIPAPHVFPLKVRRQYRLYVKGNSKLIGSQETADTVKIMSLVS